MGTENPLEKKSVKKYIRPMGLGKMQTAYLYYKCTRGKY